MRMRIREQRLRRFKRSFAGDCRAWSRLRMVDANWWECDRSV